MPLGPLSLNPSSVGRTANLTRNKENAHHSSPKVPAASHTNLRRRRRAHPPNASSATRTVAPGAAVAQAAMRRLVREGRRQRDQTNRANTTTVQPPAPTSEPMNIEEQVTPAPAATTKEQTANSTASGLKYNFPRFLPRYPLPVIKAEALAAIDEALRDIPVQFILDDILMNLAPVIQRGLAAVSTETAKVGLRSRPTEVTLLVHEMDGPLRLPTHALAIQGKSGQEIDLFPIHDVLFASHCAYLPYFHASKVPLEVATHGNGAMTLTVPVINYELPDPRTFYLLYNYLYRHDVNALLGALLPPLPATLIQYVVATTSMTATSGRAPPPFNTMDDDAESDEESEHEEEEVEDESMFEGEGEGEGASSSRTTSPPTSPQYDATFTSTSAPPTSKPVESTATSTSTPTPAAAPARPQQTAEQKRQAEDLNKLAQLLANTFALPRLLQQARLIHGVWSNVIMLGIADVGVWNAMDYAWSATMKSLVIATETVRRQQQQQQHYQHAMSTAV